MTARKKLKRCAYQNCSNKFTPTRKWQRFCQGKCRYEQWILDKEGKK